ncbi:restriction endonuclease subunit S [Janibacter anophelis]|uniref:restriction endonuclease subunit S n=1 Tax=Janibacter anophelis TaxID=319054 RepID=UPI000DEEC7AE|nr:restriction endonuclease subunit S [Janibacter anophelis]
MTPGVKLKYAAGLGQYGLNFPASDYVDEGVRLIRTTDLADGSLASEVTGIYVPQDAVDDTDRLSPGDLLLSRSGTIGRAYLAPKAADGMAFAGFLVRFRPGPDADGRFLFYCTQSAEFQAVVERDAISSTIQNFNADRYNNLEVPLPGLDEQRAIAHHLDRETARIDTLIEEQQRLIEMLRERRAASISAALEGFDKTRLRRVVDSHRPMTYGILQCGPPVEGGVPYVGPSDIVGEGLSPARADLRTTTAEIAATYQRSVLAGGDLVVSIGPAYGKVAVVAEDLTGANLTQDTVRVALRPDLVDPRFVVWVLVSRQTSDYWDREIMGATFRRLNLGTLARTPIPLPNLPEQRRIARHLDEQTAKIDELVSEAERFIELSRERRAALITAAVTGQIDVREGEVA